MPDDGSLKPSSQDLTITGASTWRRLLVEPARPRRVRESPRASGLLLATVCVGAFMGQLDASIVALALPNMRSEFRVGIGPIEWVSLSYLVVLVGGVTVVGRIADMVGRKLLYTYGFGLFTLGSTFCFLAPTLASLIAARVLQAVGAAMLQANSVALIANAVPRPRLGRAIGLQGASQAIGLAAGPSVGGLLLAVGGWRFIFLVNVPMGIVGAILAWFLLPRSRDLLPGERFDLVGALLLLPAIGALMVGLSLGSEQGWASPLILSMLGLAGVLCTAFIVQERSEPQPIVRLSMFGRPAFSAGITAGLLSYLVTFGVLFVVPFYLVARHTSLGLAGIELTTLPAALALAAPFGGRLTDSVGRRPAATSGLLVASASLFALAMFHSQLWLLLLELATMGVGLGIFTPANNSAIMADVPASHSGSASGLINAMRGMGTALGIALTGIIYSFGANADAGFSFAALFLGGLATVATVVSGFRHIDAVATS